MAWGPGIKMVLTRPKAKAETWHTTRMQQSMLCILARMTCPPSLDSSSRLTHPRVYARRRAMTQRKRNVCIEPTERQHVSSTLHANGVRDRAVRTGANTRVFHIAAFGSE